ncbi:MAG: family N-acetyltransferase [Burkholderia sp.]|nr:family N-acetyltransferase [Burkholderia sp.]
MLKPKKPVSSANPAVLYETITISCHESEIPFFVERELEKLYENIHCSLAFLRRFRALDNVSTYVVRKGARPITVLLFKCENGTATVLNETIKIDEHEIHRFADFMFARYRGIVVISFHAIQTTIGTMPFPSQKCVETEDFSLRLPATPGEYTARLGKATRDYIKRYSRRIVRSYPSFACEFRPGKDVEEQTIRGIIAMSRNRIEGKRKKFALDEREAQDMIDLSRACGFVQTTLIDGRLCAGSLSFRVGSHQYLFIIAHDREFDEFRLGTITYYFTICESIRHGAKEFHMGRGWYEYKRRLLGVREEFDRLVIYRSYWHMALQCRRVVKTTCSGYVRRMKFRLLHPHNQNSIMSRFAVSFLHVVHSLRRNKR